MPRLRWAGPPQCGAEQKMQIPRRTPRNDNVFFVAREKTAAGRKSKTRASSGRYGRRGGNHGSVVKVAMCQFGSRDRNRIVWTASGFGRIMSRDRVPSPLTFLAAGDDCESASRHEQV